MSEPQDIYRLEKLLIKDNPYWFYLYSFDHQVQNNNLLIEIGPNTNPNDKRKWFFQGVVELHAEYDNDNANQENLDFPKMIMGIDLNKNNVAVIACDDTEYSFKISELSFQIFE